MKNRRAQLTFYLCTVACMAAASGGYDSVLNNFLSHTFHLSETARGWLEFPRELPGLLVVLMTGMLCMLPVTKVGAVAAITFCCGLLGMAALGGSFPLMVCMMVVASAGQHLMMPMADSLTVALSKPGKMGTLLGQVGAVSTAGSIVGAGLIWLLLDRASPQFRIVFMGAAGLAATGAFLYFMMGMPHVHQRRQRMVIHPKFRLYYALELLNGARKQIFLTFGPWVLIQVYGRPANTIAGLLVVASILGLFFKPAVGWAIDRFGERAVMTVEGVSIAFVCLGYGYALRLCGGDAQAALPLAGACYVLDNLLFTMGTSRVVYMSRLADSPSEITSTLSMGVSVNHIASMTIPVMAGQLWANLGYERLFLAAAGLGLVIAAVSRLLPGHHHWRPQQ